MRRILVKALAALLVLVAAIVGGGYVYLRQSLPVVSGDVDGRRASRRRSRSSATPTPSRTSSARPRHDALYGLGYVHAQDRLWQMEFQRRIGHGRLSEIFGAATIPQDRFLRTVGFGRAARSRVGRTCPTDARRQIDAYVAGVNAFIATHHGRLLPPEFTLLRFEPEPLTGPDVLVWVKMMAWDLSANYSFELMRHDIAARSRTGADGRARCRPIPSDGLSILDGAASAPTRRCATRRRPARAGAGGADLGTRPRPRRRCRAEPLDRAPGRHATCCSAAARTEALGSNNWVVDGTLTASGKPLLANDPHLGTNMPSLWYLAHMSAGDFDVIGATLPGTPAVAIGRNRFIAWGETNVAADVEDLYLERLDADGHAAPSSAARRSRSASSRKRSSSRAPSRSQVDVRITRHGPLVSDAINANNAASTTDAEAARRSSRWRSAGPRSTTTTRRSTRSCG